jgi:hypothetical protein
MRHLILPCLCLLGLIAPASAQAPPAANQPGLLCQAAIDAAERGTIIPDHLLAAIGRVESGRPDARTGQWLPWPWTINAEGQGLYFATRTEAITAVQRLQEQGVRSIDVGCMQVNLLHHPQAFATLEQAFDPQTNARYAARFLISLFHQTADWPKAGALYHSATPEIAADYARRLEAVWPDVKRQGETDAARVLALRGWSTVVGVGPPGPGRVVVLLPSSPDTDLQVIQLNAGGTVDPPPLRSGFAARGR